MKKSFLPAFLVALLSFSSVLHGQTPSVSFTNSGTIFYDEFGHSLAAIGSDKVIIGAPYNSTGAEAAGVAFIFDTSGALLATIPNPTRAIAEYFAMAVASVGSDRALIGCLFDNNTTGIAYLYTTNGTLAKTFSNPNPNPGDAFGVAVAGLGNDRVLVGATLDNLGAPGAGVAYMFHTNGTLLTTITNPMPASATFNLDNFGYPVVAMDAGRILVGSTGEDVGALDDVGAAYLFNTNGVLLVTFTNPAPTSQDYFGWAIAPVGPDKVVIATPYKNVGAPDTGVAYLYNTNGNLLLTITNPTPATNELFGYSAVAVGTDKFLIGAPFDRLGTNNIGGAYLYSTNGSLLMTITNPTPASGERFGFDVASADTDKLFIGDPYDRTAVEFNGRAYLYTIDSVPTLKIFRPNVAAVAVAWPSYFKGWTLRANTNLNTTNWVSVTNAASLVGAENQVIISTTISNRYFRLTQP